MEPTESTYDNTLDTNALCALLQQNDPNTTKAGSYGDEYAVDYGRIGKALQGNTHVTDIVIHMKLLLDSSRLYHENKFARRSGTINENELFTQGEKCAELILQYISSSSVLRTLSLQDEETMYDMNDLERRVASRLAGLFFQAVTCSSSIEQLKIDRWSYLEASHESFGLMLQQTRSLRQVQILRDIEWLGGAFRSNSSLESLVICSDESKSPIHCAVLKETLSSLHSNPKMQDLRLPYGGEITRENAEVLCSFLGATSTLRRLDIDHCFITVESMECLIDGLRSNRGTIQRLGLPFNNILPRDACQAFMTYLRSTAGAANCLSDLRYKNTNELDVLGESLLIPDSIGSGLRHLELGLCSAPFLDCLSAHGGRSKLETLQIVFYDSMAEALWRCIPTFVRLRELRIDLVLRSFRSIYSRLVRALKKNGSLFKVTFPMNYRHPEPDPPGCRKRRYLDALGQRNEKVPHMLSKPRIERDQQQEDIVNNMTDIKQFPSLFAAALDAERLSPNNFLIGLTSTCDEVGF